MRATARSTTSASMPGASKDVIFTITLPMTAVSTVARLSKPGRPSGKKSAAAGNVGRAARSHGSVEPRFRVLHEVQALGWLPERFVDASRSAGRSDRVQEAAALDPAELLDRGKAGLRMLLLRVGRARRAGRRRDVSVERA